MKSRTPNHVANTRMIVALVLLMACCGHGLAIAQCCSTTVASFPYVEDFEGEDTCTTNCNEACTLQGDWFNADTNDDTDWIVDTYQTSSSSTGPIYDHNPGTSSGNYLYTEANDCYQSTAVLYSPCFDLAGLENPQVHFWYHMYGSEMGTMALEISNDGHDSWSELWTLSGDQGDSWQRAVIELGDYANQVIRLRFVGITGDGPRSDMAIDDVLLREVPCCPATVSSFPYAEDFEAESTCSTDCEDACPLQGDWLNADTYDDMDWIVDNYGTPSSSTGPTYDHSTGNSSGNYLYTETNECYNSTAVLYSPCFDLAGLENPEVHFWYHMYGSEMGSMALEISEDNCGAWTELWTLSGDQGDSWQRAVVELGNYENKVIRLRFVGTTGGTNRSDMAIDDVLLREMPCCPTTISSFPYVEDFEDESTCTTNCDEACLLQGDWFNADTYDDMDWIVDNYGTPSSSTGPTYDHNPGDSSGNYLYTEANECYDSMAVLCSPCFDFGELNNPQLSFWYSMYGNEMGSMSLEISEDACGSWTEIWSMSGDQGDDWFQANLDLAAYAGDEIRLRIIGTTGAGTRSDMAVDDIQIDGEATTTCAMSVTAFPYTQDFESESLCTPDCGTPCELQFSAWINDYLGDQTDWIVAQYGTPNMGTGPSSNHTPEFPDGNYLYTEASGCPGASAVLYSPCFDIGNEDVSLLTFYYHMYGSGMGSLSVEVAPHHSDIWSEVWSRSGNNGDQWFQAEIDMRNYRNQTVWLRFTGVIGDTEFSDMAIDDIVLNVGTTGVETHGLPRAIALHQNIPNPFNPMTEIRYDLPSATRVRIHVLDLNGRLVRTLISGLMQPGGRHTITWAGRDDRGQTVASGTYFYRLWTPEFVETQRMVLLK